MTVQQPTENYQGMSRGFERAWSEQSRFTGFYCLSPAIRTLNQSIRVLKGHAVPPNPNGVLNQRGSPVYQSREGTTWLWPLPCELQWDQGHRSCCYSSTDLEPAKIRAGGGVMVVESARDGDLGSSSAGSCASLLDYGRLPFISSSSTPSSSYCTVMRPLDLADE